MSYEEVKQSAENNFRQNIDSAYMPVVTCWLNEAGHCKVAILLPDSMEPAHKAMVADFIYESIMGPAQVQEAA